MTGKVQRGGLCRQVEGSYLYFPVVQYQKTPEDLPILSLHHTADELRALVHANDSYPMEDTMDGWLVLMDEEGHVTQSNLQHYRGIFLRCTRAFNTTRRFACALFEQIWLAILYNMSGHKAFRINLDATSVRRHLFGSVTDEPAENEPQEELRLYDVIDLNFLVDELLWQRRGWRWEPAYKDPVLRLKWVPEKTEPMSN